MEKESKQEATLEQWRALYEEAAELQSMKPWEALWDTDLITVCLPQETAYCSCLGRSGEASGVNVYLGERALGTVARLMECRQSTPPEMMIYEQRCLACFYGDREELTDQDRTILKDLGLRFRGKGNWIYFRSMTPGYLPRLPDGDQVQTMTRVLRQFRAACDALDKGEVKPDFPNGQTLTRLYDGSDWRTMVAPTPEYEIPVRPLTITDPDLLNALREKPLGAGVWEIDSFFLPTPIGRPGGAYLPRLSLLMDRTRMYCVSQEVGTPEDAWDEICMELLVKAIVEEGSRPATLCVRDKWFLPTFLPTCQALDIRLIHGQDMVAVNDFFESVLSYME